MLRTVDPLPMETFFSPLIFILQILLLTYHELIGGFFIPLILLSATTSIIIIPLEKWSVRIAREEKELNAILSPQITAIKRESRGKTRHDAMVRLYSRYSYHPFFALRSACGILVQIPLLYAAYEMISNVPDIQGVAAYPFITNLSQPDHMAWGFNLLPVLMTIINFGAVFTTPGFSKRETLQGIVLALLFLLILYNCPSALLIYWTANNFFSLIKNALLKRLPENTFSLRYILLFSAAVSILAVYTHYIKPRTACCKPAKTAILCKQNVAAHSPNTLVSGRQYAFDQWNPCFLYANPSYTHFTLSPTNGLIPQNEVWADILVQMVYLPPNQPLTLELNLQILNDVISPFRLTVRNPSSGATQIYTNLERKIEIGGVEPDQQNRVKIQIFYSGPTNAVSIASMLLRCGYSETQLKKYYETAPPLDPDYCWFDAIQSLSDDVESCARSANEGLIIKTKGSDPYLVFEPLIFSPTSFIVFSADITTSEPTTFTLFYTTHARPDFNEDCSLTRDIKSGNNTVYFKIPEDFAGKFRIDPGNFISNTTYRLNALEFRKINAHKQ